MALAPLKSINLNIFQLFPHESPERLHWTVRLLGDEDGRELILKQRFMHEIE